MRRHVLLDFDRTLNDSDYVYQRNLDGFLELTGQEVLQHWEAIHREILAKEPREKHEDLDYHYRLMIERWKLRDPEEIKAELRRRIRAAQEECWYATALFEDALPFLHRLKDAGLTLHIATGDYARLKAAGIEEQAGRKLFDGCFSESNLGIGKGKRAYFDRLLAKLGLSPDDAVILGDSLANDIGPANEVGIRTVWVRRKGEKAKSEVIPDVVTGSLFGALAYVLTW